MTWNPDRNYRANVKTGMWIPVIATIASVDYPVYAGFGGIDKLFAEGNSQHTDYELEFRTNDLPSLKVGDTVTINGDTYTVKTMPAYSDESEYFSECNLQRTTRSYPKLAIVFPTGGPILPPPPAPGPSPAPSASGVFATWLIGTNGAQTITVASNVVAVPWITINGLLQPQGSYSFAAPVIAYPGALNILSGDTLGAYLIS